MNFQVDPAALDTYQQGLTDLAGQTGTARDYVNTHLTIPAAEQGLAALVIGQITEVRDSVNANLDKLNSLSSASATELTRSAAMYRTTDRANAERLDQTY